MSSVGIDRHTGQPLVGWPHVLQSIEDILTTRVLTRVMRRGYGSDSPKLIDAPMNEQSLLALYVAIAEALEAWEPRYELKSIRFADANAGGQAVLDLFGIYYPNGHRGDRTPDSGEERTASVVLLNESIWRSS